MSEFGEKNQDLGFSGSGEKGKKKMGKGVKIGIFFTALFFLMFLTFLIMALVSKDGAGNALLLISGAFELFIAYILYKVIQYKERYTCPECGTRREHHRDFLRTTSHYSSSASYERERYEHHYLDTYVCPNCGCTKREQVKKSGGEVSKDQKTGNIFDRRIDPTEF